MPVSSGSPGRSSQSRRDIVNAVMLTAAAIIIGGIGWSGESTHLPAAVLFPALWATAPNRLAAGLVSTGYFLGASRGLPQGVANFYDSDMGAGLTLWFAASASFVLVHIVLWTARPGWRRVVRYGLAALLMAIPPFGIAGWAHPITAAGVLFPGWGWWGLAAAAIGLLTMTTRIRPFAILIFGGLWIWSVPTWTGPHMPQGWVGVDTHFRGENGEYAGYAQQLETVGLVKDAAAGATMIVLPESALGIWTPTAEHLWRRALAGLDITVNAGAVVVDPNGYDNVMLEITGDGAHILYRERMPVPVSMWQPWHAWRGEPTGARAHIFANPIVVSGGLRVAPLICYEQLIIWPVLQSVIHAPDVIVATGNGWWTENTNIVAIQKASAEAWARLFSLPIVFAFNT